MLNGHGDDIYKYNKEIVSNFSSNIYNRLDMSPLQTYLCQQIKTIHTYPEPDAHSLATLLADKHNVSTDNICITNGATEAIYLIAQAFKEKKGAILIPTFSEYEDACCINDIQLQFISSLAEMEKGTELLWFCNPNNPTGKIINKQTIISFVESNPSTIIVIDQSYQYFSTKDSLSIAKAIQYPNVITIHSMTKQFSIPGLRLGYITASSKLVEKIKTYCMPWSVNQLAVLAGKYLLKNDLSASFDIESYLKESHWLQDELSRIEELDVLLSETHFFLCRLKRQKASELKSYLIENHGILIRDAANFRGLNEHYFRLAAQSEKENEIIIDAIKEWVK